MDRGIEALRSVGWHDLLVEGQAQALLMDASYLSRPAGTTVFLQDDVDDSVYIILRGGVSVTKAFDTGEEKFVRELTAGDYFGEFSVLDPAPRSTTIRTLVDSEFVAIKAAPFRACLEQNGKLAVKILVALVRQVRAGDARLDTRRPVSERLISALQDLARAQQPDKLYGKGVRLHISRAALAERCDADVKTISRELTKLVESGAISRAGHAIVLHKPRK